jgi:hypothetical protein
MSGLSATTYVRPESRTAKVAIGQHNFVVEIPSQGRALDRDIFRLRAVLLLLRAPHGSKAAVAEACVGELRSLGFRASTRALYFWRDRFLYAGFSGLQRRARRDRGIPRKLNEEVFQGIVAAAGRIRRVGDIRREYRRLQPPLSYEGFRWWLRRFRQRAS